MAILADVIAVVAAHAIGAWLITYLLHGAVVVVIALTCERVLSSLRDDGAVRAVLWRSALIVPLVTASVQTTLPFGAPWRLSTEPAGAALGSRPALAAFLVVCWCALIALRVLAFTRAEWRARRSIGTRAPSTDAHDLHALASIACAAGLRATPRLTVSSHIVSPVALAPGEICVPAVIFDDMSDDERRALLAHEVAHHARRDPLWCGIAGAVASLCAFQPLNRFALRRLRRATEHAADADATRLTGDAEALARALATLAPYALAAAPPLRVAATGSPLLERVRRILEHAPRTHTPSPRWLAAACVLLILGSCLAIGPGVRFAPRDAANSIPSLTPSIKPPSPEMLELRTINRTIRYQTQAVIRR